MAEALTLVSHSAKETAEFGRLLAEELEANDVLVLSGDLGAGKTHFTQGLARGLGVDEAVTSPTFTLELVYEGGRLSLYHFDVYRLEEEDQLEDLDFFATLEAGGVTVIEWGDRFAAIGDLATMQIDVRIVDDETRELLCTALDERGRILVQALQLRVLTRKATNYVAD